MLNVSSLSQADLSSWPDGPVGKTDMGLQHAGSPQLGPDGGRFMANQT